jgi:microcystin-dependent protein
MADNYTDTTDTNFKEEPYNIDTGKPLSAVGMREALYTKEKVANKKDTINNDSTEYPSSKAVYSLAQALGAAALPVGTILAMSASSWMNTSAAFKNNWKVCDGTGGTPDLRGRFLRGGTASDAATGGVDSQSITLTINNLPKHNHSMTIYQNDFISSAEHNTYGLNQDIDGGPQYDQSKRTVSTHPGNGLPIINYTGSSEPFSVNTVPTYYTVIYIIKVA